uniref:Uncharacterized protein n=1 Tax=Populus alba TaxID=43335 RepID=A0A4U5Q7C2_POPAL|nr:hypothetical protein D5086_0000130500 [Populus alba]
MLKCRVALGVPMCQVALGRAPAPGGTQGSHSAKLRSVLPKCLEALRFSIEFLLVNKVRLREGGRERARAGREFLDEKEPDASTPFQVFEDMLKDNISSRTGNLVVLDLGAEVMSDVNSSSEPVKLEDLQRILSNIGAGGVFCSDSGGPRDVMLDVAGSSGDPDEGLGLGDILKPDLIMPLIETLLLEEGLTSHLPEVHSEVIMRLQGHWSPNWTSRFVSICDQPS